MTTTHSNAAFGADLQPFAGITTFMRQPALRHFEGVDVAIVGVPFDGGTSYRGGTRFGPRQIREASLMLWAYNTVLRVEPLKELRVVDYGDVNVIGVNIDSTMQNISDEVSHILQQDVTVITLGGDHSISLPLLRAYAAKFGPLALVHFDSHSDTWHTEYDNKHLYSHGTPFRRAIEEGLIDTDAYLQIGIRGPVGGENDLEEARELGAELVTINEAFEMGMAAIIERIHQKIGQRAVYITLDIDAVDPAYAPGTGTPEVGGFTSFQILQLVRGLRGLNLVGFDLVEVNPSFDHSNITAILAANLIFEYLSLLALQKK